MDTLRNISFNAGTFSAVDGLGNLKNLNRLYLGAAQTVKLDDLKAMLNRGLMRRFELHNYLNVVDKAGNAVSDLSLFNLKNNPCLEVLSINLVPITWSGSLDLYSCTALTQLTLRNFAGLKVYLNPQAPMESKNFYSGTPELIYEEYNPGS